MIGDVCTYVPSGFVHSSVGCSARPACASSAMAAALIKMIAPILNKPEPMSFAPEHESYIFHAIIIIVLSPACCRSAGRHHNKFFFIQFFPEEIKG